METMLLICISTALVCIANLFDGTIRTVLSGIAAVIATVAFIITLMRTRGKAEKDKED